MRAERVSEDRMPQMTPFSSTVSRALSTTVIFDSRLMVLLRAVSWSNFMSSDARLSTASEGWAFST